MKILRLLKLTIIVGFLSALIVLPACQSNHNATILNSLQKNVPFTIVTPAYFPDGIDSIIDGVNEPSKNDITNSVSLGLIYYGNNNDVFIWVYEENIEAVPVLSELSNTIYYKNIKIVEETDPSFISGKVLLYMWNQNGVSYDVSISGFEKIEARKIVESMIK
jgi:hypothetical protein